MAFPATKLLIKVEAAPGADLTADPSTWTWIDISTKARGQVTIRRGREDTNNVVGPSTCTLRLANEDSRFTLFHPLGAYYPNWRRGTPIRVSINPGSGWVPRFAGEVRVCDPVWPSGNSKVAEVSVTAKGILQRLGQGRALESALRRVLLNDPVAPVAYWPMEDGSTAVRFGSAIGGPPINFADMRPGQDSSILGSAPLPSTGSNANWSGLVATYPAANAWAVRWAMRLPAAPTVKTGLMAWSTPGGSIVRWTLYLTPSGGTDFLTLEGYDVNGNEVLLDAGLAFAINTVEPYGQQLYFQVNARQSGSDIAWDYRASMPAGATSPRTATATSQTISNVTQVYHSASPGLTAGNYTVGHVAVATDPAYANAAGTLPVTGWSGEPGATRFSRLCAEERISATTDTGGADSAVGAQSLSKLLDLLRQTEAAGNGLLWELTDGRLKFRVRGKRYNRTPTLALDCARGHVKLPFNPVGDDQRLKNDVSVSRTNGGTARYSAVDVRDGAYTDPVTINLADDADLQNHASWRGHTGTVEEMRIPGLPINLQSTPDLIAQWLATDIGDWLTADHLPDQYPPGQAGLVLEGYTEQFDAVTWSATLNGSPSRPWEVFQVGHDRLGRLDTAGSQLTAAAGKGATSLSVRTTSGPLWITTANRSQDFPPTRQFSVGIRGMQVPVTAITTLQPTLVGVGAAAAGNATSVTPALPAGIVAGDLLLCFAGCRNDATGVAHTPAGWTSLASLNGTAQLFGKVATGADTAPVVTFTGLAAGDTTIGQCAAFRNITATVVPGNLDQLNGSAQDIAYPAVGIPTDGLALLLYLGWKPSTWTSVATLAGATEIGEPSSALGSGMGLVWDYAVQAGAGSIQAGSFTVTGGVAAASRGAVVALAGSGVQTFTVAATPMAFSAGEPVTSWRPGYVAL